MGQPLRQAKVVFCDNIIVVYLSSNHVQHQRTKHIETYIHFVREKVQMGAVRIHHIPASLQYADIFTKSFPSFLFTSFNGSLGVCDPMLQLRDWYKMIRLAVIN